MVKLRVRLAYNALALIKATPQRYVTGITGSVNWEAAIADVLVLRSTCERVFGKKDDADRLEHAVRHALALIKATPQRYVTGITGSVNWEAAIADVSALCSACERATQRVKKEPEKSDAKS